MPKYEDDQCAQCGGIRVAKSTLCADCLVALVNTYAPAHDIAEARIKKLEEQKKLLSEMVERLLEHISSEAIYTMELRMELSKVRRIVNGG